MKLSDFQTTVVNDECKWILLGSGTYNRVYVSATAHNIEDYTSKWIIKYPIAQNLISETNILRLNHPARAVRKWNSINPDYPAWVIGECWIAPYLGHQRYDDIEDEIIGNKIIEIYQKTGNIITDGCGSGNFIRFNGKIICVDVDLALQQDSDDSTYAFQDIISDESFRDYLHYYANRNKPYTVSVIRTLLYLDRELYDVPVQDKELYFTPKVIAKLHVFREQRQPITRSVIEILWRITRIDPDNQVANKDITPAIVKHLQDMQEQQHVFVKLAYLINLISCEQESPDLKMIFNFDFDTPPDTSPDTLAQGSSATSSVQTTSQVAQQGFFSIPARHNRVVTFSGIESKSYDPKVI